MAGEGRRRREVPAEGDGEAQKQKKRKKGEKGKEEASPEEWNQETRCPKPEAKTKDERRKKLDQKEDKRKLLPSGQCEWRGAGLGPAAWRGGAHPGGGACQEGGRPCGMGWLCEWMAL